ASAMTLEPHCPIKIGIISVLGVMITLGNIAVVSFGLLIMPLNLCVSFMKEYNVGPDPFCHVVAFFNATIYSTCMYTLATISLERYIAVFYRLKFSTVLTRRRALFVPISFPAGIIEVQFSRASLVYNPLYSSNVSYSLSLTCFIFFVLGHHDLLLWIAVKRQRLKLSRHSWGGGYRPKVALRVLVPVMTVYYTCWTPCMVIMLYNAISGSGVPEWIEFIAVWLPTSNGFLNCIFYFWINHSFRRKFHLVLQKLCLGLCPGSDIDSSCVNSVESSMVPGWNGNGSLHERFSSLSSTCTLLTLMPPQTNVRQTEPV
uniref:Zgc:162592 n=1 Tax=Sinocyclocheilus grahami TaxID=75366 RepID=A0A672NRI0_SINGR